MCFCRPIRLNFEKITSKNATETEYFKYIFNLI